MLFADNVLNCAEDVFETVGPAFSLRTWLTIYQTDAKSVFSSTRSLHVYRGFAMALTPSMLMLLLSLRRSSLVFTRA